MPGGDKTIDLLNALRGTNSAPGLKIVKVNTADPYPLTFAFEGTEMALSAAIFEIPVSIYPLVPGDRLLTYQMTGGGEAPRWGILSKLTGGVVLATMQSANSLKIDGIDYTYAGDRVILPPFVAVSAGDINNTRALQAGDRVSIAPMLSGGVIKYVVLQKY